MNWLLKLIAMPYVLVLLLATATWFAGSAYWYVCQTHDLCQFDSPASTNDTTVAVGAPIDQPANESQTTVTQTDEQVESQPYQFEPAETDSSEAEATAEPQPAEIQTQTEAENESGFVLPNNNQVDTTATITAFFNPDAISFRQVDWEDEVKAIAAYLADNPEVRVQIEGHTAKAMSETNEQQLSLARAEALKEFMVTWGAPSNQVQTVARGYDDPLGDNSTDAGRERNRRAELSFVQ